MLDDGKLSLKVVSSNGKDTVKLKVVHGGLLHSFKELTCQIQKITLPCLTRKDRKGFSVHIKRKNRVDWTIFCPFFGGH